MSDPTPDPQEDPAQLAARRKLFAFLALVDGCIAVALIILMMKTDADSALFPFLIGGSLAFILSTSMMLMVRNKIPKPSERGPFS